MQGILASLLAIIGGLATGFRHLSKALFTFIWNARLNLLAILVLYVVLWQTAQGRDMLVAMPERAERVIGSFCLLTVLAGYNWFYPRLFDPINKSVFQQFERFLRLLLRGYEQRPAGYQKDSEAQRSIQSLSDRLFLLDGVTAADDQLRELRKQAPQGRSFSTSAAKGEEWGIDTLRHVKRLVPRMLGVFTLLLVGFACLRIHFLRVGLSVSSIWLMAGAMASSIGLVVLIERLSQRLLWRKFWRYLVALLLIAIGVLSKLSSSNLNLLILFISLSFVAIVFCIIVTVRLQDPLTQRELSDRRVVQLFFGLGVFFLAYFIYLNCQSSLSWLYPLSGLCIALIFYIGLLSFVSFGSERSGTYLLNILVLFCMAMAAFFPTDLHQIPLQPRQASVPKRVDLSGYLHSWTEDRAEEIQSWHAADSSKYPVFLVLGEGGGSRAAYWTSLVLSTLEDSTATQNADHPFSRHLLGITTVSGSSFGSATYLSLLLAQRQEAGLSGMAAAINRSKVFEGNYLSTSLLYFMGADFWRTVLPFLYVKSWSKDRAVHLQQEWGRGVGRALDSLGYSGNDELFTSNYLNLYYDSVDSLRTDLPLYIPNTTEVQSGNRTVISPVRIIDTSRYNSLELYDQLPDDQDITLGTAALLSARFPYINPAGRLLDREQYVDGGYYDNAGGTTAEHLKAAFEQFQDTSQLGELMELHLVFILNDYHGPDQPALLGQLVAPPSTIYRSTFSGHTEYWIERLRSESSGQPFLFGLDYTIRIANERGDSVWVIMPLARYISQTAGAGIRANLERGRFQYGQQSYPNKTTLQAILDRLKQH